MREPDCGFDAGPDQRPSITDGLSTSPPSRLLAEPLVRNATSPRQRPVHPEPSGPSEDALAILVDVFFDTVYPMPSYAFLHPDLTKARCLDRRPAHHALVSALCAVAALYLGGTGTTTSVSVDRETTASWILAAEQSIWLGLESPTVPRLQTLLLIIHYHMETGRFQRAFMLTATAARFAAAMRLNHERPDLGPIPRELRRRALWSLKIIERYFSVGIAEFDLFPQESIYIDFPATEEAFTLEQRPQRPQEGRGASEEGGAYRLLVRLERIRVEIMQLTRSVASLDKSLPSLLDHVRHHDHILAGIASPMSLPGGDLLVPSADAADPTADRWLARRVLAYVSWHQAHCDLYRILLRGYPEAAPDVVLQGTDRAALAAAEQHCLHHASRIIQIITTLNQNSTRHVQLEFDTAICAYHATRLVLFISRFGTPSADRPTPEYAASRAALCLAALKRFFPSSVLVAPIIRELEQSLQVFLEQQQQQQQRQRQPHRGTQSPRQSHREHGQHDLSDSFTSPPSAPPAARNRPSETSPSPPQQGGTQQFARRRRPSAVDDPPRQRLAIHSLLRQADFSGDNESDDDDDDDKNGQQTNNGSPAAGRISEETTATPVPPPEPLDRAATGRPPGQYHEGQEQQQQQEEQPPPTPTVLSLHSPTQDTALQMMAPPRRGEEHPMDLPTQRTSTVAAAAAAAAVTAGNANLHPAASTLLTHNMGAVGGTGAYGAVAFSGFDLDGTDDWDMLSTGPSAFQGDGDTFQDPGDVAMATATATATATAAPTATTMATALGHPFFAWWGPQDWDWLFQSY